jgi:methylmalonyl-CoA epimerase
MSTAMLSRIDHVGIAVHDLDQAIDLYERRLGLKTTGRERLEAEGVEVAMIPIGESRIELLTPLGRESKLHKFLSERGEAVHHVAYATDDVAGTLQRAAAGGAQLIDDRARPGAHGTQVAFIHPKSACGVLTELVEADGRSAS